MRLRIIRLLLNSTPLPLALLWVGLTVCTVCPLLILGHILRTIGNWIAGAAYWERVALEDVALALDRLLHHEQPATTNHPSDAP